MTNDQEQGSTNQRSTQTAETHVRVAAWVIAVCCLVILVFTQPAHAQEAPEWDGDYIVFAGPESNADYTRKDYIRTQFVASRIRDVAPDAQAVVPGLEAWRTKTPLRKDQLPPGYHQVRDLPMESMGDTSCYPCQRNFYWNSDGTPNTSFSWNFSQYGYHAAHKVGIRGAGVTVAVIDTGFDAAHEDAPPVEQILPGWNIIENNSDTSDDEGGHGTAVAGVIVARETGDGVTGVAPGANFMPVVALTDEGSSMSYAWEAMHWALDNGADLINVSLGGMPFSDSEEQMVLTYFNTAFEKASTNGALVVCASGNNGNTTRIIIPASHPGCIAAGSVASSGERSTFSNSDSRLDLVAPGGGVPRNPENNNQTGIGVMRAHTTGDGAWRVTHGTSAAAPHVVGVLALLMGEGSGLNSTEARNRLFTTTIDTGEDHIGRGIVNPLAALDLEYPDGDHLDFLPPSLRPLFGGEPITEPEPELEPEPEVTPEPCHSRTIGITAGQIRQLPVECPEAITEYSINRGQFRASDGLYRAPIRWHGRLVLHYGDGVSSGSITINVRRSRAAIRAAYRPVRRGCHRLLVRRAPGWNNRPIRALVYQRVVFVRNGRRVSGWRGIQRIAIRGNQACLNRRASQRGNAYGIILQQGASPGLAGTRRTFFYRAR